MLTEIRPNSRTLISDQATRISDSRKRHNIITESLRMARDQYVVMQGTIQQATLHDELQSCNLLS